MRELKQSTISNHISCYGIGVHSGAVTQLTLKPAKPNMGIVFVRTDIKGENNFIEASYGNVFDTSLSTCIKNNNNVSVSTIEHLMAAIWGCGIDNLIVELDGPEVPIMDGSSKPFVFMIECSGRKNQNAFKKYLKIIKEIKICDQDSEICMIPSDFMQLDLTIDFKNQIIGKQNLIFSEKNSFKNDLSEARTFGFLSDLEFLQGKGLAKGASLDNSIGIDNNKILNPEGLRDEKEFVKHKALDLFGDLYSSGSQIIGSIYGYKTGHNINNQSLRKVFSNNFAYKHVRADELTC